MDVHMSLDRKYNRLLQRHRHDVVKYWDALMGEILRRQVPAHLICIFNAPTEALSQAVAARLPVSFLPLGANHCNSFSSPALAGYGGNPPGGPSRLRTSIPLR